MSCKEISSPALDKTMPVKPPIVKSTRKPREKREGAFSASLPAQIVASQLNIFIPVGIAIIIVEAIKYALVSTSKPTVYIWWAQTIKPKKPMAIIAKTIPLYPNIGLHEKILKTWLIMPKPGSIKI